MTYLSQELKAGIDRRMHSVLEAARDKTRVAGLTHGFYRYPARFSPTFARAAIDEFTEPGDLVLDPFMGGGTSLVEARSRGRRVAGSDASSLAVFIARSKTTALAERELIEVIAWIERQADGPLGRESSASAPHHTEYLRNFNDKKTWRLRKLLELALQELDTLPTPRSRRFARSVLLRTAQWAADTRRVPPNLEAIRNRLRDDVASMADGLRAFRRAQDSADRSAGLRGRRSLILHSPAEALSESRRLAQLDPPRLVVTSPPYPGVHVLYHRWQIGGGKETPAPFWIAGEHDGAGASSYTLADRHNIDAYFERHTEAFKAIASCCDRRTVVVQLIAFSDPPSQLPRYLESMERAGFRDLAHSETLEHRWRSVPSRKWYSERRGATPASKELVLFHGLR